MAGKEGRRELFAVCRGLGAYAAGHYPFAMGPDLSFKITRKTKKGGGIGCMERLIIILIIIFASFDVSPAQQVNRPKPVLKTLSDTSAVTVLAVDNRIKVANAPVGSKIEIYSVVGIKVAEMEIKQAAEEYVVDIAKGYYIVRIDEMVCKIAIR
jgi:hypothetical protein